MYEQTFTIGERVAALTAARVRAGSNSEKREMARRRAAFEASQTFPNDRFIRQPRREEKPVVTMTPRERFARLHAAYLAGPLPRLNNAKPRRHRAPRKSIVGVIVHGIAHAFRVPQKACA